MDPLTQATPESKDASERPLHRVVVLRLSEIRILVRELRRRAYECKAFASEAWSFDLRAEALESAAQLEARANEIAQDNASLSGSRAVCGDPLEATVIRSEQKND